MTYPEAIPELSNAVVDTAVEPTVTRIGVVAAVVEADNITVRISGSDVLVPAAYLFPQYLPLVGDRVVVQRQGAAWFVLGTLSGPINTKLANPSFELNPAGAVPDDWSIQVLASGAGVPTLTVFTGYAVSGSKSADFGCDSVGAGTSRANVFCTPVPAAAESKWTAAFYLSVNTEPNPNDFTNIVMYMQFLDATGALVVETAITTGSYTVDQILPDYFRLSTALVPSGYLICPPGAAQVRLRIDATFNLSAASFFSFFFDYMILRQVR